MASPIEWGFISPELILLPTLAMALERRTSPAEDLLPPTGRLLLVPTLQHPDHTALKQFSAHIRRRSKRHNFKSS
jgi:hypothetical protein